MNQQPWKTCRLEVTFPERNRLRIPFSIINPFTNEREYVQGPVILLTRSCDWIWHYRSG